MENELKIIHNKIMTILDSLFLFKNLHIRYNTIEIGDYLFVRSITKRSWDIKYIELNIHEMFSIYKYGRIIMYINYIPPINHEKSLEISTCKTDDAAYFIKSPYRRLVLEKVKKPNLTNYFLNCTGGESHKLINMIKHSPIATFRDVKDENFIKVLKKFIINNLWHKGSVIHDGDERIG